MILLSGHTYLNETSSFTIASDEIISPISCRENCTSSKHWSFNTSETLRVRVTFENFIFTDPQDYIEIGDGLIIEDGTRLTHFSGTDFPSNVTTVTNAAWITIHSKCNNTFKIGITAVNNSGRRWNINGKVETHSFDVFYKILECNNYFV